jgi:EF hand
VTFGRLMFVAILATSGLATLDAVPVAAQGNPGGVGGQGAPGGPPGGVGGPHGPGGLPGGGNPAEVMFQMLDTNRDKVVTKQEFFGPHEQRFGAMDTNKDGRLTPEEFNPLAGPPTGSGVPLQQRR